MARTLLTEPLELPSDQDATGRSFGETERELVLEVLDRGTLTATKGPQTPALEREFAELLGVNHVSACASGSAAVHAAVAAIDPEPGDEIITTPVTDMGALSPILYQGAIPVFADVDSRTGNVTAQSVRERINGRTRAVIVTHLFGNPAEVDEICAVARAAGIPVIEDCAQAYLAKRNGRFVGTFGDIACFSVQQGKHITAGEGGLVITNDDALARRIRLWINKAWPYGEAEPDHEFLALNARISELQSAVARGQLQSLPQNVSHRMAMAERLTERISGVIGVEAPLVASTDLHSYWRYCLRVDNSVIPGGPTALAAELRNHDIASAPRYIQKPAFRCAVFREQRTFGQSRWPFTLAQLSAVDYSPARFMGTFDFLDSALVLPWNERFEPKHVDALALRLVAAVAAVQGGAQ